MGTVLAILAAWGLARLEYRLATEAARLKANRELATLNDIIEGFEEWSADFVKDMRLGKIETRVGYARAVLNDPHIHAMSDLGTHIPITSWPSIAAYMAFKQYWFAMCNLRNLPDDSLLHPKLPDLLARRDAGLAALREALESD